MPEVVKFKSKLAKSGNFATAQRLFIFKYLQQNTEVSINKLIRDLPDINQATIYRNIKLFERLGIVNRLQLGWHSRLELSSAFHNHHHHMTCNICGKITTWEEDSALELRIQTVAMMHGFIPQDHQLEIRGICKACS